MNNQPVNGWGEWSKYVLKALEGNERDHEKIMAILTEQNKQLAMLQVKSGIWGFAAGSIPTILLLVLWLAQGILAGP